MTQPKKVLKTHKLTKEESERIRRALLKLDRGKKIMAQAFADACQEMAADYDEVWDWCAQRFGEDSLDAIIKQNAEITIDYVKGELVMHERTTPQWMKDVSDG